MKKLWILSAATMLCIATAHAQTNNVQADKSQAKEMRKEKRQALKKLQGTGVSDDAKQAFAGDFGNNLSATWERTDVFDKATFTNKGGIKMVAYYDADARLVGTTEYKNFEALPAKAQQIINSQYADYTKGTVVFFDDNEANETDMILYDLQFDDVDCYFMELSKGGNKIVLQITIDGRVSNFTQIR